MFIFSFAGCLEEPDENNVVVPSNLEITVDVAADGSGEVTLQATAEDASYYTIFFSENSEPIVSEDGKASYTYTESGNYKIKVQAHAAITSWINKTETITVDVHDPAIPIIPEEGYETPASYPNMTLVWEDDFEGTTLNENDWTFEIGNNNGWGNNERQYYTAENALVENGHLIITAKRENINDFDYTSSRIVTRGKQSFQYGRIDIRAALPKGQGIWPALWMLGENIGSVGWPASGEIDIMEMIGGSGREKTVHGTLHWDNSGHVCTCDKPGYSLTSGTFNDKFHVFSIVWTPTAITWYMDDIQFNTISITPEHMTEFHEDFFLIFNLAVGGNWPGYPDDTTILPQHLIVDYVRVFQNN